MKSHKRKQLSEDERERRAEQRRQSLAHLRLLYTRAESAAALNVCTRTIIRLEESGRLSRVRLAGAGNKGRVYNPCDEVHALAQTREAVNA